MADETKTEPKPADVQKTDSTHDLINRLASVVDKSVQTSEERFKSIENTIAELGKTVKDIASKAMQTPTDLPLKPAASADEDIGAKVEAPDTYQSNSVQAGITEEDKENSRDGAGLAMQKSKTFTTQTPRPGAQVQKGANESGIIASSILKAARDVGYAGLEQVARDIRAGKFGTPEGLK